MSRKEINKTIGSCECISKGCTIEADIRRIKNKGQLYLDCSEHGSLRLRGQKFQNYILDNGTFFTPETETNLKPSPGYPGHVPEPGEDGQEKKDVKVEEKIEPIKEKGFLSSMNDFEL